MAFLGFAVEIRQLLEFKLCQKARSVIWTLATLLISLTRPLLQLNASVSDPDVVGPRGSSAEPDDTDFLFFILTCRRRDTRHNGLRPASLQHATRHSRPRHASLQHGCSRGGETNWCSTQGPCQELAGDNPLRWHATNQEVQVPPVDWDLPLRHPP